MAKKGLIYETLNEVKSMDVRREDGMMHLSGVFGVCGVKNNNHRVYEMNNYKKMVESMQTRLQKAPIPGELEHPQTMNITTENISHRIDSISIDDNGVVSGEITLLNTPKGKIAQALVEGGLPLFISSRATGQVDKNGNVTLETLQTYDLVGSPGFSQAELHLNENQCFESINENICFIGENDTEGEAIKENNNIEMTDEQLKQLEDIKEQLEDLRSEVEYLQERNNLLQEQLNEKDNIDIKAVAEGIQNWMLDEYTPNLQKWIVEEYSAKVQEWIIESYGQEVQNWVTEHFQPEIQKWVVEKYSPEVSKWITEEFAPEIQNWILEEYCPTLQKWMETEFKNNITESLDNKFNSVVEEAKTNKLSMVDSILEMLSNTTTSKPAYGRKASMTAANTINEGANGVPKYIAEMPADLRVKYDLAPQEIKESIQRRARIYNWNKDNAIQSFWESVDFDKMPVVTNINEGLNNIVDERERAIRASIRSWRNR